MTMPLTPGGVWKIDTSHTQLGFSIRHLGISTVRGFFTEYDGSAVIGEDLPSSSVEVTAKTASINTGNGWRDGHLHGADFMDVENFPEMTFRSSSLQPAGDGYALAGDLTIKGVSKPIVFDLTFHGTSEFPMDKSLHAGFFASTTISRSDFNISYGVPLASDEVGLHIDAQLIAPSNE
ncbi:MAG: polyisoprenoid-binding protein [Ilumatobacteraceae bacterium]|nr:polyisoprenoid-binding protein [Ilumatobacteraceae bacterium]